MNENKESDSILAKICTSLHLLINCFGRAFDWMGQINYIVEFICYY